MGRVTHDLSPAQWDALKDAWGGTTRTHYDREGYFTRVRWQRDD